MGEHLAQRLGVAVGQSPGGDVLPGVGIAPHVGVADPGDLEHLELVVLPDAGEGDPVVDLRDLVEGAGRVLGHEGDSVGVLQRNERTAPGDALAGVVGPVLHHLLGRDVERHAHRSVPLTPAALRPACGR